MAKNRTMAIKHDKAKKEAMKEIMNTQNDFAQTSWGTNANIRKWWNTPAYSR